MHTTPIDYEPTAATDSKPPDNQSRRVTVGLIFLASCVALIMTGFGIIVPVFPQRLQSLGLGVETLALMEGAFGLGMFLFSTPMGTLADRIGRKPVILISLAGFIVTNLALALVNVPFLFVLIRFVEGVVISGLMPASMAMVGDSVPLEKQGRWIGFITTAMATGIALGPGIGGFLYQAWGFTSPFLLSASIAFVTSLLAVFTLQETLPKQVRERAQQSSRSKAEGSNKALSTPMLAWLFAPLLAIDFGLTFTFPFSIPQYPFFFERVLKYDAAQYGVIISIWGLGMAVFPLILGRLSETLPKKALIVLGCLLCATLNAFMLFLPQYAILIVAAAVTGLGNALYMPAMGALFLAATNDQNRSKVMGIRGSAFSLAVLLGPLTQAAVSHWITSQTTFAIGMAIPLFMALVAFALMKNPQRT